MAGISIDLTGVSEAAKILAEMASRMEHPRPLYDAIGSAMVLSTDERFDQERDPQGNPWPPSIRVLTVGGKTLTDTARLAQSITHDASDAGVEWGSNVIYAAIQQQGGTIRARNAPALSFMLGGQLIQVQSVTIPARPFLGVSEEDEATILALVEEFVMEPAGVVDAAR